MGEKKMSKKLFVILFTICMSNLILMLLGILFIMLFGTDILCYIGVFGAIITVFVMLICNTISILNGE
jgi:hypothetical protein